MRHACLVGGFLAACAGALHATSGFGSGHAPAKTVPAIEAVAIASSDAVRLDGDLADTVWTRAIPVTEFRQRDPNEGAAPTHPTDVRVAFDGTALYVAVRAIESHNDRLVGMLTRRDESSPSDWVRVAIDSYRDRRTAYEFAVNVAGVKLYRYWFADNNNDTSWDAVWDVAVSRGPDHWTAEFRIPFSQLRFNPSAGGTFGFAALRTIAHENETSTWPLLARSASGFVSSFGDLTGLSFPASPKKLELLPYALGQLSSAEVSAGNPLASARDGSGTVGLDLKYRMTPGLTLTGTANPDFGQVEADPAVVNLSAFETFFPERRPFFVEGSALRSTSTATTASAQASTHGGLAARPAGWWCDRAYATASERDHCGRAVDRPCRPLPLARFRPSTGERAGGGGRLAVTRTPVEPMTSYGRPDESRICEQLTPDVLRHQHEPAVERGTAVPARNAATGGIDTDWRLAGGR
jgi:hypothetical protein